MLMVLISGTPTAAEVTGTATMYTEGEVHELESSVLGLALCSSWFFPLHSVARDGMCASLDTNGSPKKNVKCTSVLYSELNHQCPQHGDRGRAVEWDFAEKNICNGK